MNYNKSEDYFLNRNYIFLLNEGKTILKYLLNAYSNVIAEKFLFLVVDKWYVFCIFVNKP